MQIADQTGTETAIALGLQLAVIGGFVLAMTVVHSVGLLGISKVLGLQEERLKEHEVDADAIWIMARLGLLIFILHLFEIALFAIFYLAVGGVDSLEEGLYQSASAYATLGQASEYFPTEWRLVAAVEALIGFILIGWSTAFLVSTMNKLRH